MKKILGLLTPFLISIFFTAVAALVTIIVTETSTDAWASMGAVLVVFIIGAFCLIVFLIISVILYNKKYTDYWLYVLYGYASLVAFGVVKSIITFIYNSIVG